LPGPQQQEVVLNPHLRFFRGLDRTPLHGKTTPAQPNARRACQRGLTEQVLYFGTLRIDEIHFRLSDFECCRPIGHVPAAAGCVLSRRL
jgi:hypothetical protein